MNETYAADGSLDELEMAISRDHDCPNLGTCDIAAALHAGFVLTSAWLLRGATHAPHVEAVISTMPDFEARAFEEFFGPWSNYFNSHFVLCPSCNGQLPRDYTNVCPHCGEVVP